MTPTQNYPSTMKMELDADWEGGDAVQGAVEDAAVDAAEETKEVAVADVMVERQEVEDSPRAPTNRCTTKRMEAVTMMMMRCS